MCDGGMHMMMLQLHTMVDAHERQDARTRRGIHVACTWHAYMYGVRCAGGVQYYVHTHNILTALIDRTTLSSACTVAMQRPNLKCPIDSINQARICSILYRR